VKVLVKKVEIKILKDFNSGVFKKDDIISVSEKAAKNAVEQGAAEYVIKNIPVLESAPIISTVQDKKVEEVSQQVISAQDGVILSPKMVGDNLVRYPLDKDHTVAASLDGVSLSLQNRESVLYEWFVGKNDKCVLLNSKTEQQLIKRLVALGIISKKKESEQIVVKIVAHFLALWQKAGVTSATRVTGVCRKGGGGEREKIFSTTTNPEEKFEFDTTKNITNLQPATGIIKNKQLFYYGQMIPTKKIMINEETNEETTELTPKLAIITTNHEIHETTTKFQKENKISINQDLSLPKPRWQLEKIKQYLDAKEHYNYWTPKELFEKIREQFKKFVWFDQEEYYDILPTWIIGTYYSPLFTAYPYINLWGFKNTGKTKVMQLSGILSFNSQQFVNMSPASLFRIVESDCPTLYIDEAEQLFDDKNRNEENADIISLLNAGWMQGSEVPRIEQVNGEQKIKRFKVYCPKMLASIKGISGALESRSIRIIMVRPKNQASSDLWMQDNDEELCNIRNETYPACLKNWQQIDQLYDDKCVISIKKEFALNNRDWQMWKPLLCIAKLVSEELYQKLGKWAVEETERMKTEEAAEDDWDTIITECLFDWIKSEDQQDYFVHDLKVLVDDRFVERIFVDQQGNEQKIMKKVRPSNSFIGRFLNKVGFHKYRKRKHGKNLYFLSRNILVKLLDPVHSEHVLQSVMPPFPVEKKVEKSAVSPPLDTNVTLVTPDYGIITEKEEVIEDK